MNLPDLSEYRKEYQQRGIALPLTAVPHSNNGLLAELPACAEMLGWPWTEETDPALYRRQVRWPKITIVTPSFNQAAFLEQTIRSVLLQNYPNLEYVIIDGGSTDASLRILNKYARWISYFQCENDHGQSNAINRGFSLASGEVYAWINSDDYYLKNVFHTVVNTFIKSRAGFVYGYGYNYSIERQEMQMVKIMPVSDFFIKIPGLIQPSTFWKADIHQPVWEELHCSLDFELWLRLVKGKKKRLIRQPLSVANIHMSAKSHDPEMKAKWQQDHLKIWSDEGHGMVHEWRRIVFLNRLRKKFYQILGWL